MKMKMIKTIEGYDAYEGKERNYNFEKGKEIEGERCFALVPHGDPAPASGYYWASSAVMMKHEAFTSLFGDHPGNAGYEWAVGKAREIFGDDVK
jgi:hypothetical protein